VIILIITNKLNRAIASLAGAVIVYFVLIFLEGLDFSIIVDLLFGSQQDGFVNLHSLILIIGMMLIVAISHEAGLFQFFAARLIKLSKGKPIRLMIILCVITIIISAILNNILTVIVLIPLTITISRMLNTDPSPYILTEAVLVNIGGTLFPISSIPNILITTYAEISFLEFFLNVGLVSLMIFVPTIIFFIFLYKKEMVIPEESKKVLEEFNVWNVVQNKKLLYYSLFSLLILFVLMITVPSTLISMDMIALTIALILIVLSRIEPKDLISKIDFELILYLLGIFVIAGGLEITGIVDLMGNLLSIIGGNDLFTQLIVILWISAYFSSNIDNIPITKVLTPIIGDMVDNSLLAPGNRFYYSLAIGANWGDNLTPLGDNILVMNLAEQNKRPITFKKFFKLGFTTTNLQLFIVSIYYLVVFYFFVGIIILIIIAISILVLYFLIRYGPESIKIKINNITSKFRNLIIK